jgi:phosphocarrier protein
MQTRILKIINRFGLHSRAAAKLVTVCSRFQSTVTLVVNGRRANGRHLVALLMLSASMGAQVYVEVRGPDEAKALDAVTRLISDGFGEPQ